MKCRSPQPLCEFAEGTTTLSGLSLVSAAQSHRCSLGLYWNYGFTPCRCVLWLFHWTESTTLPIPRVNDDYVPARLSSFSSTTLHCTWCLLVEWSLALLCYFLVELVSLASCSHGTRVVDSVRSAVHWTPPWCVVMICNWYLISMMWVGHHLVPLSSGLPWFVFILVR